MARIYWPKVFNIGQEINIDDRQQIHCLRDVLRLKLDDDIFVFDGHGKEYLCQIQELSRSSVRLTIKAEIRIKPRVKSYLAIACALTKQKGKFDDLVDKLSQLGVDKIIPMITERVIPHWDSEQKQRNRSRWHKIAKKACAQSGRNALPIIEPVREIDYILHNSQSYDLKLIPTLMGSRQNLRQIINDSLTSKKSILVLIGPEGDFSQEELNLAAKEKFIPVFLGEQTLCVDTAALTVASFLRLYESNQQ